MSDYLERKRRGCRDRDIALATRLRRDIVHAARVCELRLREADRYGALYPGKFEDFGGFRKGAVFWLGFAFNAAKALKRLQQPKDG